MLLPLIALSILWAFGVMLGFVLLIVPGIILLMMWAVAVPALVGLRTYTPTAEGAFSISNLVGGIVIGTVFNTLWGTIQPSLYVELWQWKEGDSADSLAKVFANCAAAWHPAAADRSVAVHHKAT